MMRRPKYSIVASVLALAASLVFAPPVDEFQVQVKKWLETAKDATRKG